jgi:xyloglucan-specific exo-beta-1,4-glucanase
MPSDKKRNNATQNKGYFMRRIAKVVISAMVCVAVVRADVIREYWSGVAGTAVTDLTAASDYPANPTGVDTIAAFDAPRQFGDDYGARVRGLVRAPVSGTYTFHISSNGSSELWLSTDAYPTHKRLIAAVSDSVGYQQWDTLEEQR